MELKIQRGTSPFNSIPLLHRIKRSVHFTLSIESFESMKKQKSEVVGNITKSNCLRWRVVDDEMQT